MRLQACLNGSHRADAGRPVPVAPRELADAAREAVRAGAEGVHIHPKRPDGADDLSPEIAGAAVEAIAAAVPGIQIGVTTAGGRCRPPLPGARGWNAGRPCPGARRWRR
jgi:uncharacterized protein (DUF849 family)